MEDVLVEGGVSRSHSRRNRLYTSLNDDNAPFSCTNVSDVTYPETECAWVTLCSSTRNRTAFATAMTPAGSTPLSDASDGSNYFVGCTSDFFQLALQNTVHVRIGQHCDTKPSKHTCTFPSCCRRIVDREQMVTSRPKLKQVCKPAPFGGRFSR